MPLKGKAWHEARARAARSRAAKKAAETRARNRAAAEAKREQRNAIRRERYAQAREDALRKVARKWGTALDKARSLNTPEAWAQFRRAKAEKDRVRDSLDRRKWRRMTKAIGDAASDFYDADWEES